MKQFKEIVNEAIEHPASRFTDWYGFDTENDKNGKVTLAAMVHESGADRVWDGAGHMMKWCESAKGRPVVICHNLEYDLVNEFGIAYSDLQLNYLKGRLISAKYHNVTFWDSFNHFRMSLEEIGNTLGIKKLKMDIYSREYVKQDAWISLKVMIGARDFIAKMGGRIGATSGSSSVSIWRHMTDDEFMIGPIDSKWLRSGYYGGRTEIFQRKTEGVIRAYDINSMYPYCMLKEYPEMCYPDDGMHKAKGMAEVTISIPHDLYITPLVHRSQNRLIYPVGVVHGVWTYDEIHHAVSRGVRIIKVHKAIGSNSLVRPFGEFIESLYAKRQATKDPAQRLFLKVLMNALYGKIASNNTVTRTVSRQSLLANGSKRLDDVTWITYHRGLLDYHTPPQPYVNMVWGSMITAYSRLELTKWMMKVPPEKLIYCDTDSIFTVDHEMPVSDKLGALKQVEFKGIDGVAFKEAKSAFIPQPKVYAIDELNVAKGVPRPRAVGDNGLLFDFAKEFIETGTTSFMAPIRFRQSLRSKQGLANQWITVSKSIRSEYKHKLLSRGRYFPPVMGQQLELGLGRVAGKPKSSATSNGK